MTLLSLLILLVVLGFVVWLVMQLPLPQPFRTIILGVAVFAVVIYILVNIGSITHLSLR